MTHETDYTKDFIVTWKDGNTKIQEGFSQEDINRFSGKTDVEKILNMYDEYNETNRFNEHRKVFEIVKVNKEILFSKK